MNKSHQQILKSSLPFILTSLKEKLLEIGTKSLFSTPACRSPSVYKIAASGHWTQYQRQRVQSAAAGQHSLASISTIPHLSTGRALSQRQQPNIHSQVRCADTHLLDSSLENLIKGRTS